MARLPFARERLKPAKSWAGKPRRKSARERGYDAAWERASHEFLEANPFCLGCAAAGKREPSTVTDHVVPHKGDRAVFWDRTHWQPSCTWHHSVVKQALEQRYLLGAIEATSLWLDSPAAQALSRQLAPS